MILKNAAVLCDDWSFKLTDIRIENDKIAEIKTNIEGDGVDLKGNYIIPGLVDIHTHACVCCDYCDANHEHYQKMSQFEASRGTTSLCPTTMTLSEESLAKIFASVRDFRGKEDGAYFHGINMEGPYFSHEKRGAQNPAFLAKPDYEQIVRLNEASGNNISLIDIAPELENSIEFIKKAKSIAKISVAHTNADYDTTKSAFENGASHCTHFFNAMPSFLHRAPGVIGAALESDNVTIEVIGDGLHLHPAIVRILFKLVGADRICLISDSMEATGMPDGDYQLGGQTVLVRNGKATLEDGVTIAGSTSTLMDVVRTTHSFGIKLEDAVKSATITPAKTIGVDSFTGSITVGKNADLVVLSKELDVQNVFVKGKKVK